MGAGKSVKQGARVVDNFCPVGCAGSHCHGRALLCRVKLGRIEKANPGQLARLEQVNSVEDGEWSPRLFLSSTHEAASTSGNRHARDSDLTPAE